MVGALACLFLLDLEEYGWGNTFLSCEQSADEDVMMTEAAGIHLSPSQLPPSLSYCERTRDSSRASLSQPPFYSSCTPRLLLMHLVSTPHTPPCFTSKWLEVWLVCNM